MWYNKSKEKNMITQRAEIFKIIDTIPDELLIDVKNILDRFLLNAKKDFVNDLTKERKAYNNLQKFRRKGLMKSSYKDELTEALSKKYEDID